MDNKLYDHLSHWWVRVKVDCGGYAVCLVAQSCPALCNSMDCSLLGSLSMGFSRKEYWSGLPFPPPGDLPKPGIKPRSPALQVDSVLSEPPGKHTVGIEVNLKK